MTEAQWLTGGDPGAMLEFLRGKASERKLRLFACSWWSCLEPDYAGCDEKLLGIESGEGSWEDLVEEALSHTPAYCPLYTHAELLLAARGVKRLRDIFGNPFRPTTCDPAWRTPDAVALARAAYDERQLPAGTLDTARLVVLADALEEAGCDSADLLNHLRQPGDHVRGCWAVDAILGKE
jgi:hypothetical protein